jgi:hypothetical protein
MGGAGSGGVAGGATSGGAGSGGLATGGASSGGETSTGGVRVMDGGPDAGNDASLSDSGADAGNDASFSDSGADAALPNCPSQFADGDVWDKTYVFQQDPFVPLVVGPNGRLYAGFYRGYAFSGDDGRTWQVMDLSGLIPAHQAWSYPTVNANGNSVWLFLRGYGTLVSRNAGRSFALASALSGLTSFDSGRVLVSPYHDQHMLAYASREDAPGSLAGSLYRSIDGGNTWMNLDAAIAKAGANGAHAAAFDPSTADHFWIGDMPEGVLETNDGGGSFTIVMGSTHSYLSNVARTFDGTNYRLMVTGACGAPTSTAIGQNSWQASTGDSPGCCPWPIALADPFNPASTVLEQCHDSNPANLRYSTNGGVTFNLATWPTSLDTSSLHVSSAYVDPFHRKTFYAVHANGWTILKSTDGGATYAAAGWLPGHGC